MRFCFILQLFFLILLSASCTDDTISGYQSEIIVEGWIDQGDFPVVILTTTFPLESGNQVSQNLSDYVVRWAKVTISDGENEQILTGKYDDNYYPPFIYTTYRMRGEVGKTYSLRVEYEGKVLTAESTLLPSVPLDSVVVSRCTDNDTLYQIKAFFTDSKTEKNYYKFFTQVKNKETRYYSSFLGTIDDSALGSTTEVLVYKGQHSTYTESFIPYYSLEDVANIKFTQISKAGFEFWNAYENATAFSSNFFYPISKNIPSNVVGGKGIWCAYGVSTKVVSISESMNILHP